jgi:hypothetical protein
MDGSVKMNGVGEIVGVPESDPEPVTLFHADSWTRHASWRDHPLPFGGEDPEGDKLAGVDFLLDLDDLQVDRDLVGVAITVEISAKDDRCLGGTRDTGFGPLFY